MQHSVTHPEFTAELFVQRLVTGQINDLYLCANGKTYTLCELLELYAEMKAESCQTSKSKQPNMNNNINLPKAIAEIVQKKATEHAKSILGSQYTSNKDAARSIKEDFIAGCSWLVNGDHPGEEPERPTFRNLVKELLSLPPDQLDQPARGLVDDEGAFRTRVEVIVSAEPIYSDPNDNEDGGYPLKELQEIYPDDWERIVQESHITPAGTVFIWVDKP